MAARLTQIVLEVLKEGDPHARLTQEVIEVAIQPPIPNVRLTQMAVEVAMLKPAGEECSFPWVMPIPNRFPRHQDGGPRYKVFAEITPDWAEFGQVMGDNKPDFNTLLDAPIRRFVYEFEVENDGGQYLDNHYESTRGGAIPFEWIHPETDEVFAVTRYDKYERPPHEKMWLQNRSITLIVYPV